MEEPKLNGVPLADMGWIVKSQTVPRAEADLVVDNVPGMDGYIDLTHRIGGMPSLRPMEAQIVLSHYDADDEDIEDDLRALWGAMCGVEATYTPWDMGGLSVTGVWQLKLERRDGRRAEVLATGTCMPELVGNGFVAQLPAAIDVPGTRASWPVFRLVADGTGSVMVQNLTTGLHVELLEDVSEGDVVTIDCQKRSATVGTERARVTLASDWIRLMPGENDLKVFGCTGTVTFHERWV